MHGVCECAEYRQGTETEAVLGWGGVGLEGPRLLCKSKESFQAVLETGEHSE